MSDDFINRAALRHLFDAIGGNPEDLEELLGDYCSTAPELAADIEAAADAGDLDALRIAAHTLKSNARDFGALRLSSLCADLERHCRAGTVPDPKGAAAEIRSEEAIARKALADLSPRDLGP